MPSTEDVIDRVLQLQIQHISMNVTYLTSVVVHLMLSISLNIQLCANLSSEFE